LLWAADRLDLLERAGGVLERLAGGTTVLCAHYAWWVEGDGERGEAVGFGDPIADCLGASRTRMAVTLDPQWLERIHARCMRPDLTLHVADEQAAGRCQQQVAALLWPGEEAK
jgi:hypothetical protein